MNVLIWMTGRGGELAGGHRVQMDKTAEALRELGVEVETAIADEPPRVSVDLVHGFGLTVEQVAMAKARGLPVALSTIYWPRRYYRRAARARSRARYVESLARNLPSRTAAALRLRPSWDSASRAAFAAADLLLPNSRGEAAAIRRDLRVRTPARAVPNGFDVRVFTPAPAPAPRERVVYVGRIEPHKNQLRLIEALRDTELPLSIVGSTHPHHEEYAARCRAAAAGQAVEFWPQASQAELAAVYRGARVHAMPELLRDDGARVARGGGVRMRGRLDRRRLGVGVLRPPRRLLRAGQPALDPRRRAARLGGRRSAGAARARRRAVHLAAHRACHPRGLPVAAVVTGNSSACHWHPVGRSYTGAVSDPLPRASLIVLNYNGDGVLGRCLESLAAAMGPADELIVVDNASPDGSGAIAAEFCAQEPHRHFISRPYNNYIFGLNDGLAVARGRYVGFLNNDNCFEPGSIDRMLAHFAAADTFAVCPRIVRAHDGEDQGALTSGHWRAGLIFYKVAPHQANAPRTFFAVGGQSLFDRAKLLELGSIDELLYPMYHEDIELSWRAWKRGYEIRYAPDAVVRHIGSHASQRAFTAGQLRALVRQNEFLIVWKNVTDPALVAEHLCCLPLRLAAAFAKRDWPTLRGFWRAARRLGRVRAARAEARLTARLSDREVLARVSARGLGIEGVAR